MSTDMGSKSNEVRSPLLYCNRRARSICERYSISRIFVVLESVLYEGYACNPQQTSLLQLSAYALYEYCPTAKIFLKRAESKASELLA